MPDMKDVIELVKVGGIPALLVLYMYGRDKLLADSLQDLGQAIREKPAKT